MSVSRPHVALALGAILVGGLAIYLFLEVRATPAVASVTSPTEEKKSEPRSETKAESIAKAETPMFKPPEKKKSQETPVADTVKHEPTSEAKAPVLEVEAKANPKQDAILDEVNKAYDHGEYDDAKTMAIKILANDPKNVRMLRVVISSSCILGDAADAQKYFGALTEQRDKDQMKTRCARYGVTFDGAG